MVVRVLLNCLIMLFDWGWYGVVCVFWMFKSLYIFWKSLFLYWGFWFECIIFGILSFIINFLIIFVVIVFVFMLGNVKVLVYFVK